tara:strand:+ start:241 stop:471 length:231 start_codon:yes stop_codon:yes gene_type:complete
MTLKGFEAEVNLEETPNLKTNADKPLNSNNIQKKRVDINVLKARAKALQDKENTKNTIIIIFFLVSLGGAGIFFSI